MRVAETKGERLATRKAFILKSVVVGNRKEKVVQDGAKMAGRGGKAPSRIEFIAKLLGLSIQSGAGV